MVKTPFGRFKIREIICCLKRPHHRVEIGLGFFKNRDEIICWLKRPHHCCLQRLDVLGLGEWFCEEAASPLLEDRITAAEGLDWGDLETLDRTVDLGSEFSAQTLDTTVDLGSEFRRVCAQRMAERRARLPAKGSARCPGFVEPKWLRIGTLLHVRAVRQSRKPAR